MSARIALILNAVTAVVATVALVISLTTITDRVNGNIAKTNANTAAIRASAYNACTLLRAVILATTSTSVRPQAQTRAVAAFLAQTPLKNCRAYARDSVTVGTA